MQVMELDDDQHQQHERREGETVRGAEQESEQQACAGERNQA